MVNIRNITVLFLLSIIHLYNAQTSAMKKYRYDAGIGTPENYDIDTYRQTFYSSGNEMVPIPGLGVTLGGQWGMGNSFVIRDELKEVPALLKIGYYSYIENKFFEGEFRLPEMEIEKLLQEKIKNPVSGLESPKYNYFSVGVALNGVIVLWIRGNENQKEIQKFQALEKKYEKFSDVIDDERSQKEIYDGWFKNYSEDLKRQIAEKSLPYDNVDLYRKKYKLKINPSRKVTWLQIGTINMEKETLYADRKEYSETGIPYNIWLKWMDQGKEFEARIIFSKDEKYYRTNYKAENGPKFPSDFVKGQTYNTFTSLDQEIPAELVLDINPDNTAIRIFLQQKDKKYVLNDVLFKIFKK